MLYYCLFINQPLNNVILIPVPFVQSNSFNQSISAQARIMAAQERAKNAQLKQASTAPPQPTSMEFEKEKMMRALNGITSATADAEQKEEPLPIINTAQKPPPSFDVFEKQMQQMNMQQPLPAPVAVAPPAFSAPPMTMTMAPPPPAFDSIASQVFKQQSASAPSAPTISSADADLLGGDFGGIMPMAPPSVNISAPSFDQVMQQNLLGEHSQSQSGNGAEDVYDFELDESGMKMSPEEKQRMVEEQRAIMEHIERQARDNKASEAAVKADAFASRMTGGSMPSQSQSQSQSYAPSTSVDGFSASEIEEQRKILEQIEAAKESASSSATGTQIQIGDGQKVQLHGQEKTKEAINEGTAQLVLCLNCNNWMQVVGSATLMYCPICSVVTPVVKQDEVMSKEEILQMEADRKMAEMLQAEENAVAGEDVSDYPGNRTAAGAFASSDKTWWGALNDALVGVGIAAPAESSQQSAEINVTRPPGSQRTLHSAVTGEEGSERIGLLGADDYGGDDGRPEARVAQSQPLFSCIVDSVSNTAAAAGSYMMGEDDDEEVHGVDSTSFLSVPNAGRDKNDSEGNYFAIPPNE